jgi:hypothetical protein
MAKVSTANLSKPQTDHLIGMSYQLKTEDGRIVYVQSWAPTVSIDGLPAVTIIGLIGVQNSDGFFNGK